MRVNKPFYLMRHGQILPNTLRLAAGASDFDLTNEGERQAVAAAKLIDNLQMKPDRIFHSALIRSKKTAGFISEICHIPTVEIKELDEHNFGVWEGLPYQKLVAKLNEQKKPENGETRDRFVERTVHAMDKIWGSFNGENPLIVAHGGTFFALGWIYHHIVSFVDNCELYHYCPDNNLPMPWSTWRHELNENNQIIKKEVVIYTPKSMS